MLRDNGPSTLFLARVFVKETCAFFCCRWLAANDGNNCMIVWHWSSKKLKTSPTYINMNNNILQGGVFKDLMRVLSFQKTHVAFTAVRSTILVAENDMILYLTQSDI